MDGRKHADPRRPEADRRSRRGLLMAHGGQVLGTAAAVAAWSTTGKAAIVAAVLGVCCLLAVPYGAARQSPRIARGLAWRPSVASWVLLTALAARMVTVDD